MFNRLLSSLGAELHDSFINFYVCKDEAKQFEDMNIKRLYNHILQDKQFQDDSLNFRLYAPNVKANVKTVSEEDMELFAIADSVRI